MHNLVNQITIWVPYIGTALVLVVLIFFWYFKNKVFGRALKISFYLTLFLALIDLAGKIYFIYSEYYLTSFGKYLVKSGFLFSQYFAVSFAFVQNLILALAFFLLALLVRRFQKKEYLNKYDPLILLIVVFASSSVHITYFIVAIVLALILALIWGSSLLLRKKKQSLEISPFLLMGALLIYILGSFSFFKDLLTNLRLY